MGTILCCRQYPRGMGTILCAVGSTHGAWVLYSVPKNPADTSTTFSRMEKAIQLIKDWMSEHTCMLKMNDSKTEVMVIHPKCNLNTTTPSLKISGISINPTSSVRNLGVLFDSKWKHDKHINQICSAAHLQIYTTSEKYAATWIHLQLRDLSMHWSPVNWITAIPSYMKHHLHYSKNCNESKIQLLG